MVKRFLVFFSFTIFLGIHILCQRRGKIKSWTDWKDKNKDQLGR